MLETPDLRRSSHDIHVQARYARSLAIRAVLLGGFRAVANWLRAFGRITAWLAHWAAESQLRQHIRALQKLDDRILQDIGISRGEIEYTVRNGPSSRTARTAALRQRTWRELPPMQDLRKAAYRSAPAHTIYL